jgi:hypothetical protein
VFKASPVRQKEEEELVRLEAALSVGEGECPSCLELKARNPTAIPLCMGCARTLLPGLRTNRAWQKLMGSNSPAEEPTRWQK